MAEQETQTTQLAPAEMLREVNTAIYKVLVGGQSYQIGSRKLTRADLSLLRQMKNDLEAQVNAEAQSPLLDNTYVAFFEGR